MRMPSLASTILPAALVLFCAGRLPAQPAGPTTTAPAVPIYSFPPATKPPATPDKAGGITEAIYADALHWFDRAVETVDKMAPVAEKAAERIIAGGRFHVTGNAGFYEEMHYRAGGFAFARGGARVNSPNAVIVFGQFRPNEMGFRWERFDEIHRYLRFKNPMAVYFASHHWPQVARVLPMADKGFWGGRLHRFDTGAPEGSSPKALALGQMATAALAWAFQGEIIAAAARKGKTLATYASDHEPDGKGWDRTVRGQTFHPKHKVPPIPAGKIGREYLKICRGQAAEFLATQPGQVRLAARRMAACMKRGGMVWLVTNSHLHPQGSLVPSGLRLKRLGREYNYDFFGRRLPKGDMLLWLGYLDYPAEKVQVALDRGCDIVTMSVDAGPTDRRRTHIRSCWKKWDTVIELPNYPIRVLPTSGVVGSLQWYAILAETLAEYEP